MAIHHPTPRLGGGERPRLPSAQVGPVTQAIRAMRAAEPVKKSRQVVDSTVLSHGAFVHGIRALSRTEVEDLIGGLIDLLDAMDGDTDLEADYAHTGRKRDGSLCTLGRSSDDEGFTDDNGIADLEAAAEQGFPGYGGCL
ncbi:hypothetical protein [Methylobacterium sp. J-070]|uniref:hypothetical protein n=1 Tax=Methylobacterium sp. J-070 TaxID=2836650 RepID=UPI001FB92C45|nr:hypothetical protein [Methylobacterium sp. J-070]MCJ2048616.1 hypothetical protein [Methylobacterium sp. J-070]